MLDYTYFRHKIFISFYFVFDYILMLKIIIYVNIYIYLRIYIIILEILKC